MKVNRQQRVIDYLVEQLKDFDNNIVLYLKGSIARQEDDEFSDVDFYCYVPDDRYEEMLEFRDKIIQMYQPVLYKEYVDFGLNQVIVIFNDNVHLDFYVTSELPINGTDDILILYDKYNICKNYNRETRVDSTEEIVKYLNDAIYTLVEIDAAYNRNDKLWLTRLISQVTSYVSLVLCHVYNPYKPVLHMKGIYIDLPMEMKMIVDSVLSKMDGTNMKECIVNLVSLIEATVELMDKDVYNQLSTKYLAFAREMVSNYKE